MTRIALGERGRGVASNNMMGWLIWSPGGAANTAQIVWRHPHIDTCLPRVNIFID